MSAAPPSALQGHYENGRSVTGQLATLAQLPCVAYQEEAVPLAEELERVQKRRGAGPHVLSTILPAVLAKLEVNLVRSTESGEVDPTERQS